MQASQWYSDLAAGTFQTVIHWGAGGSNPFVQYQNWLDYNTFVAPSPTNASADYGPKGQGCAVSPRDSDPTGATLGWVGVGLAVMATRRRRNPTPGVASPRTASR